MMSAADEILVRDVGTLVEFAPTSLPPPPKKVTAPPVGAATGAGGGRRMSESAYASLESPGRRPRNKMGESEHRYRGGGGGGGHRNQLHHHSQPSSQQSPSYHSHGEHNDDFHLPSTSTLTRMPPRGPSSPDRRNRGRRYYDEDDQDDDQDDDGYSGGGGVDGYGVSRPTNRSPQNRSRGNVGRGGGHVATSSVNMTVPAAAANTRGSSSSPAGESGVYIVSGGSNNSSPSSLAARSTDELRRGVGRHHQDHRQGGGGRRGSGPHNSDDDRLGGETSGGSADSKQGQQGPTEIGHTMASIVSMLYAIILSSVGIAFAITALILFPSGLFNVNYYYGYLMYLYSVGIVLQLLFLFKKMCDAIDAYFDARQTSIVIDFTYHAFGSEGFRIMTGILGVGGCLWYLLEFVWRIDITRESGLRCSDRGMEIGVLGLVIVYALLHIFIVFYNTKLLVPGYELIVIWGLMHLVGTDLATWAWTSSHLTTLALMLRNDSSLGTANEDVTRLADCELKSPLVQIIDGSHPYLGLIALLFFLFSAALLASIYQHYTQSGSFHTGSTSLETMMKRAHHSFSIGANWPGIILALILFVGSIFFIVYHYLYITWQEELVSWAMMEIVTIALESISICFNLILVFIHHRSSDNLSRTMTLETVTLIVSLFFVFIHHTGQVVNCFISAKILPDSARTLTSLSASSAIIEVIELWIQCGFLLSSLRFYAKFFVSSTFRIQQSLTLYLIAYNVAQGVFAFMRQYQDVYGIVYAYGYGIWGLLVWSFWFKAFIILHRLFSATCHACLWLRSYKTD